MKHEPIPVRLTPDGRILNAMSVDIEEFFQVGAFETTIQRDAWTTIPSRVDYNTRLVMDLFAQARVSATFFTLGWVAERNPALIRDIVAAGHELASHGYAHDRVHQLTPEQFRADLRKTRTILEDLSGERVRGYRAPSFSIGKANQWALTVLAEEGYDYSSSVYPIAHDHYGWPEAPRGAFRPLADSPMIEIPCTTARLFGRTVAAGGGGFFRLLPYGLSRHLIEQVNRQERRPAIFYFHPWEVDADQPVQADAPLKSRLRHYVNLDKMAGKLARVLADFAWDRTDRVYLPRDALRLAA